MQDTMFTCPHCLYKAPMNHFESVEGGMLKCKRCRSRFDDPNAFRGDTSYADCDSQQAVFRFPFALNGRNTVIRVREGYLAYVICNDGRRLWLSNYSNHVSGMGDGFQLYYICLSPRVNWGVRSTNRFGVYGNAQLALTGEYVQTYCYDRGSVQTLEKHLRELVVQRVTEYVQAETDRNETAVLEHREGYLSVLGALEDGASLTVLNPIGYRTPKGYTGTFPASSAMPDAYEAEESLSIRQAPLESLKAAQKDYTVKPGTEEVLIRSASRIERHKAGEMITLNMLRGVQTRLRFRTKEFDFPYGWGVYNQPSGAMQYFSAHGTISFFIDNTEQMGFLFAKAENWEGFEDQFFTNVLRTELSAALGRILKTYTCKDGFDPKETAKYLSAMSVELTDTLNGEDGQAREPAFRQYGLRVFKTDILDLSIYGSRR